jgi:hypothetical protein
MRARSSRSLGRIAALLTLTGALIGATAASAPAAYNPNDPARSTRRR